MSRDRDAVLPLSEFPPEHRRRIEELVAQREPPPRWLDLGRAKIESRAWYEWRWARGMGEKREPLSATLRAQVLERYGYVCGICRLPVEPDDVHIDHIHPVARGGETIFSNLQVAHSRCNLVKGAKV